MPRGRRKADTTATGDETPATDTPAEGTAAAAAESAGAAGDAGAGTGRTIRRRRRRNVAPNDTPTVVEALLRTRGPQGATQEELEQVVTWARAVRSEGQALTDAMKRPTRQKQEKFGERVVQHEMNTVLLNGVLAGSIGLDVKNGSIVYLHGNGSSNVAAADTGAMAGEPLAADAGA